MKYVKKPVVIEAFQWDGGITPNPDWVNGAKDSGKISFFRVGDKLWGHIFTISGNARFDIGDYIVNAGNGDIYPVKETIFEDTYSEYIPKKVKNK